MHIIHFTVFFKSIEHASPAFDEFVDCIGEKIRLKDFEKYRAQLDNKSELDLL